jgi:DNA polymerase I
MEEWLSQNKRVYLVDGSAYLYRAYYAIRNLSNSKGFPTNMVFGFTRMIMKLLKDKRPEYLAVVFDSGAPTFRHEIYPEYKGNRSPMPEEMAVQIPIVKEIIDALLIPMIEKEGYEADDLIGTLARQSESAGFEVIIVTGDKDFRQVVTPMTSLWDPMKDLVTDFAGLKALYGFDPQRIIDVMALSGDASDNIPGVPGIGEKIGSELVRAHGSLEGILQEAPRIKGKRLSENLLTFSHMALMSRDLVTIDRFVDLGKTELKMGVPDGARLCEIFKNMEFHELWEQFASPEERDGEYRLCLTEEALRNLLGRIREKGVLCLATESTDENPFEPRLVGISLCYEEKKGGYIPVGHRYTNAPVQLPWSRVADILKPLLEDETIAKVGHNLKHEMEVLKLQGIDLRGMHFDTMLASYIINPGLNQYTLPSLAQVYLNHRVRPRHEILGKGKSACPLSQVDVDKALDYCCENADIPLRLMPVLQEQLRLDENEKLFDGLEMKLLPVLARMEMTGVRVDLDFLKEMSTEIGHQIGELERQIYREAGAEFNINSPKQLGFILFEKLQLPAQKKTAKNQDYSTDVKVLKKMLGQTSPLPKLILRYRTLSKIKSTYLDGLNKMVNPVTGRVHTSFNQTVAATGRLSSSNPNLQNIPVRGEEGREIRKAFVADEGHHLVSADYSQIELRVFAHYSGDDAFVSAFRQGEDIHSRTAAELFHVGLDSVTSEMRRIAKVINFGIIYGMGPQKLSEEMGFDLKTAKEYMSAYYERYKGVVRYRGEVIAKAMKEGYVSTLFNRRRYLPHLSNSNRMLQAESERMAINTPIQGTAADLIKRAMLRIHERLDREPFKSRMLLQVHDELLFESPAAELDRLLPMIREEMENVYRLAVPLRVEINVGKNWYEAHG